MNKFVKDLIEAEEKYLKVCGWSRIKKGRWKNPRYTRTFSQDHALLVCKASDQNMAML